MGIQPKIIRCDNAGENNVLEAALRKEEFNIEFQYTASGTPQQNGVVERGLATLYGKLRSTLNSGGISRGLRKLLWAECAGTVTDTDNLLVNNSDDESPHEKFYL